MLAELANLNHCAVPFLAALPSALSWYDNVHKHVIKSGLSESISKIISIPTLHFNAIN